MKHNPVRTLTLLGTILLAATFLAATPATLGYGSIDQWQLGFSGTCQGSSGICPTFGLPPSGGGFWGWCAFGGSSGSSAIGTTGTSGDCQITVYLGSPSNSFHVSADISKWLIATGSAFLPPGVPGFFFGAGTQVFTGPGAAFLGIPTHVPIPFSLLCNLSNFPTSTIGNPNCDSGLPAVPGHTSIHAPGFELEIQVTKLP